MGFSTNKKGKERSGLRKIVESAVRGFISGVPILGTFASEMGSNRQSETAGEGKIDQPRAWVFYVVSGLVVARLIFPEHISWDNVVKAIEILSQFAGA